MAIEGDVDICNLALHKVGNLSITAAELADPGNEPAAYHCASLYEPERDMMLAAHPWNFALKRVEYNIDDLKDTITASTAASPVVITGTDISVANILEGLGVYIWDTGIDDLDGDIYVATNVVDASQTLELYKRDRITKVDGSAYGVATSGYIRLAPLLSEYDYMFKLPDNCLRVFKLMPANYNFTVEQGYLLTDDDEPHVKYIEKVTDVSKYPAPFVMALATKMAAELWSALAGKPKEKARTLEYLEKVVLPRAQRLNAIEKLDKTKGRKSDLNELTAWQKEGH